MRIIELYLLSFKRQMKCERSIKKSSAKKLRANLKDFLEQHPQIKTYRELKARFGAPKRSAENYYGQTRASEAQRKYRTEKTIKKVAACGVVLGLVVAIYLIYISSQYASVIEIGPVIVESTSDV